MVIPPVTPEIWLVFAFIALALVLFVSEVVPVDITAIGIMVGLMLVEPMSTLFAEMGLIEAQIEFLSPSQGLSGFASGATLAVLAMFILSDGVQKTGIVQRLGRFISKNIRPSETHQLGATISAVGPISGFINNTAAVAILLPMVTELAEESNLSPSKLLMPLSFASMFGGMLTVIGTSTNILASEIAARPEFLGRPFSMFEFTQLGIVLTIVGTIYLLTLGRWLTPARIKPGEDLTEEFRLGGYLTEVVVREDSPLIGKTLSESQIESPYDVDIVQLIRDGDIFLEPLERKAIRAGDIFVIRTDRVTLVEMLEAEGFELVPDITLSEDDLEAAETEHNLQELVIAPGSDLVGETLASFRFRDRYDATVLALRRGKSVIRTRLDKTRLRVGDTLLVQATARSLRRLDANPNFIVAREIERRDFRTKKTPVALGIVAGVVGLAAVGFLPIVVAALAGSLGMVLTGCVKPSELYDSIQWDVIFLLAGVIPLGIAMETSGAADLIAALVVETGQFLPTIGVLAVFYLVTAILTNIVSNNASVVLMVPVAFEAATALGANPFAFILAVTFAASAAFLTPIGYQTNLFVYGPGGYRFSDYFRVGAPLQLIFAVVTTIGIAYFWGV